MFGRKNDDIGFTLLEDGLDTQVFFKTLEELKAAYPEYEVCSKDVIVDERITLKKGTIVKYRQKYYEYCSYSYGDRVDYRDIYLIKKSLSAYIEKLKMPELAPFLAVIRIGDSVYALKGKEDELIEELKKPHKPYVVKGSDHPYWFIVAGKKYYSNTINFWRWQRETIFLNNPPMWILEEYNGEEKHPNKDELPASINYDVFASQKRLNCEYYRNIGTCNPCCPQYPYYCCRSII